MQLIAVDICNTLADVNSILLKTFSNSSIDLKTGYLKEPELSKNWFKDNLWVFKKAQAIDYAPEGLNIIAERYGICYITQRPVEAEQVTSLWLLDNGFPPGKILMVNDEDGKVGLCKKYGIKMAIDDLPFEINSYLKAGIKVAVPAQPYNKNLGSSRFEWRTIVRNETYPLC